MDQHEHNKNNCFFLPSVVNQSKGSTRIKDYVYQEIIFKLGLRNLILSSLRNVHSDEAQVTDYRFTSWSVL